MKENLEEELDELVEKYENGEIDFKELLHQITYRDMSVANRYASYYEQYDNSLWEYADKNDEYFAREMAKYIDEWSMEDFQYAIGGSAEFEHCAFIENEKFMEVVLKKFPSIATWSNNPEVCDDFLQRFVEPELDRLRARVAELERKLEQPKSTKQEEVVPVYTPEELSDEYESVDNAMEQILGDFEQKKEEPSIDE